MRYSSEWRSTVERLGRWIDFDNDYVRVHCFYLRLAVTDVTIPENPECYFHGIRLVGI
jgi:hypothetical protein